MWNLTTFIVTYVCILTSKRSMVGYPFHFAALGTLSYYSTLRRNPWLRYVA